MAPPVPSASGEAEGHSGGGTDSDYYRVLGVSFDATEEDIRKQYHRIVRTLHPDRRRVGGFGGQALEHFHQVQSAWRCLADPARRLLYDLRNFGRSALALDAVEAGIEDHVAAGAKNPSRTPEARLLSLQKEQAVRDVENMEVQLQKVMQREHAARGVFIKTALYGDLRLREDRLAECLTGRRQIEPEDLVGPVLDVVVPLQCLVEQHKVVIPGGAFASKADLPGFYNPAPLDPDVELSIYVLYEFRGVLHEVLVGDHETLSLPYRRHAVPAGNVPRGPFSPANVELLRRLGSEAPSAEGGRAPDATLSQAVGTAALPKGPVHGSLNRDRVGISTAAAKASLRRAVRAYTLRRLQPPASRDEATPREFKLMASTTLTSLVLAAWWASRR